MSQRSTRKCGSSDPDVVDRPIQLTLQLCGIDLLLDVTTHRFVRGKGDCSGLVGRSRRQLSAGRMLGPRGAQAPPSNACATASFKIACGRSVEGDETSSRVDGAFGFCLRTTLHDDFFIPAVMSHSHMVALTIAQRTWVNPAIWTCFHNGGDDLDVELVSLERGRLVPVTVVKIATALSSAEATFRSEHAVGDGLEGNAGQVAATPRIGRFPR